MRQRRLGADRLYLQHPDRPCPSRQCGAELRSGARALGGEDTAFFAALSQAGGRIAYAPDAIARETVPEARARLGWLLRRRFRMGQTHGSLLAEGRGVAGRLAQAGLAGAKALACLGLALIGLPDPLRRNSALTRASLHLGVIAALLGMRAITLYGQAAAAQHGPPQTPEARRS